MIVPYELIYRNSLQAIGDFHSQFFADCMEVDGGNIVAIYFKANGVTDFTDDWYFGLKVNGSDVLSGADRPHITAGDLEPFTDGLSIPVVFLDRMSPTVDARATGVINGPITVIIMVDDGAGTAGVDDTAYDATSWNGVTTTAPSKNAVRDKIVSIDAAIAAAVDNTAYDATTWDGDMTHAPSKNAVRDKIEAMGSASVSDTAYDETTWNGVTTVAPSKNAVRDELEIIIAAIAGGTLPDGDYGDITVSGSGTVLTIDSPISGKRITPRIGTTASSTTPTPDADAHDEFTVTALAAGATFAAPSGTPTNGQDMIIRIKDNGTARSLAWNAIYRAIGVTLPTTTVISKTLYIGMIYNTADSKWDVLGVSQEA